MSMEGKIKEGKWESGRKGQNLNKINNSGIFGYLGTIYNKILEKNRLKSLVSRILQGASNTVIDDLTVIPGFLQKRTTNEIEARLIHVGKKVYLFKITNDEKIKIEVFCDKSAKAELEKLILLGIVPDSGCRISKLNSKDFEALLNELITININTISKTSSNTFSNSFSGTINNITYSSGNRGPPEALSLNIFNLLNFASKCFVFAVLFMFIVSISGCFLDDLLGKDKKPTTPAPQEKRAIVRVVAADDISSKVMYKSGKGARCYMKNKDDYDISDDVGKVADDDGYCTFIAKKNADGTKEGDFDFDSDLSDKKFCIDYNDDKKIDASGKCKVTTKTLDEVKKIIS